MAKQTPAQMTLQEGSHYDGGPLLATDPPPLPPALPVPSAERSCDPSISLEVAPADSDYLAVPPPPPDPVVPPPPPVLPAEDPRESDIERRLVLAVPSWLVSMVFHLLLMVSLALFTFGENAKQVIELVASVAAADESPALDELTADEVLLDDTTPELEDPPAPVELVDVPAPDLATDDALSELVPPLQLEVQDMGSSLLVGVQAPGQGVLGEGVPGDGEFGFRNDAGERARMIAEGGGTPESEAAVDLALAWLAEHQNSDGSWNFNHATCPGCNGRCSEPGLATTAKNAATAMALLPFLGRGETHKQGKYQKNVQAGLYYLVNAMETRGAVGSFHEPMGRMYAHGLASIVLCEAYGMTRDKFLEGPAQSAINFIVAAQDPRQGGWRYDPGQRGDTSVVGWQMMALKSGHMAYLHVPVETVMGASYYLDGVQSESGALYGYMDPGSGSATTAIGLLCRMYLGWKPEHPALQAGVAHLSDIGPSIDRSRGQQNNMYYNYYATQVMHHYGGPKWEAWNEQMREYLIKTQAKHGHEKGSWHFVSSEHGHQHGGRLYFTSLAVMTLEVYYRHMPLYGKRSTQDNFNR